MISHQFLAIILELSLKGISISSALYSIIDEKFYGNIYE